MFHRASVLEIISDMSKDAYGFRMRKDWNALSDSELESEVSYMQGLISENIERDRLMQDRAYIAWTAHIAKLMEDHNIPRATALRWDMDAMDACGDTEFYCYLHNIPYSLATDISKDLN